MAAKSVWNEAERRAIVERLDRLSEASPPRWGQMDASRMVSHVADGLRMALGELDVAPKRMPLLALPLVKQFVIYWAPFPRNAPTAPELIGRAPGAWEREVRDVTRALERFASREPAGAWPPHPLFGALSGTDWGVLIYRHVDHHLRQFGA